MGYYEISQMSQDTDLILRVQACAAQEQPGDPYAWTSEHMLHLAASPGWDAAWTYAINAGNEHPGKDPGVISDGMILSAVQSTLGKI